MVRTFESIINDKRTKTSTKVKKIVDKYYKERTIPIQPQQTMCYDLGIGNYNIVFNDRSFYFQNLNENTVYHMLWEKE